MGNLSKYSVADWVYGVGASLIAAVIFAGVVFVLRWLWRWVRNFSAQYRRDDQTSRIVKIFVYRRYIQKSIQEWSVYSLVRGQFFVLSRCLHLFIAGVAVAVMGQLISWVTGMQISFYLFLGLAFWLFCEAGSWLNRGWSKKSIEQMDEKALAAAAVILGESIEEVRSHVTQSKA